MKKQKVKVIQKLTAKRIQEYNSIESFKELSWLLRFRGDYTDFLSFFNALSAKDEFAFMESTLKKYARKIEQGEVNPHIQYDGKESGLILDPLRKDVPLGNEKEKDPQ